MLLLSTFVRILWMYIMKSIIKKSMFFDCIFASIMSRVSKECNDSLLTRCF